MTADVMDVLPMDRRDVRAMVHLFCGPYVTVERQRVEVPDGGQRLLAFVALHHRPVDRRYAAAVLWPDGDDVRAAGNLRSTLWRLNLSGTRLLVATRTSLTLPETTLVDVDVVSDWARRLIDGVPRPVDLDWLPWGLDAFDVLPGWYEDWALMARERIRSRVQHGIEALSYRLVDGGRADQAVEAATLAVAADPLRESAQRALIEALIAEGNWAEARRRFEGYRDLLENELSIAPGFEFGHQGPVPFSRRSAAVLPGPPN